MKKNLTSLILSGLLPAFLALIVTPTQAVNPPPDGGYAGGNTAEGHDALNSLTDGTRNTGLGFNTLFNTTTGSNNTAVGAGSLRDNVTGVSNTAVGTNALLHNKAGGNTGIGSKALMNNKDGVSNTATGFEALLSNTIGFGNTATGHLALVSNRRGSVNTAVGGGALFSNVEGFFNTAVGYRALNASTFSENTATGFQALMSNTGQENTANGSEALSANTSGNNNIASGWRALFQNTTGNSNTAYGSNSLSSNISGSANIALGDSAGINLTDGSNNIDIGNPAVFGDANTIRIGTKGTHKTTFIAGINGTTVANGVEVVVGLNGKLGTIVSSARFKDQIKPMDRASEAILALKPVAFRYKQELDPDGIRQFGLIAEDVEKVNPALVVRDDEGKPLTVRYEAVNAMLLNEFIKEHRRAEEQRQQFEARLAQQQKQIESLMTGLQKVNRQVEMNKPASQVITQR